MRHIALARSAYTMKLMIFLLISLLLATGVEAGPAAENIDVVGDPTRRESSRMAVGLASCNQVHRGVALDASRCTEAREQLRRWESTRPAIPKEHEPPPALRLLERDAWQPAAPLRLLTSRHSGDNGEAARFLPLLQRMQRRQPVTILALGSSITGVHGGCTHPAPLLEAPSCRCPKCCGPAPCRRRGQHGRPERLVGRGWPEPGVAWGAIWR